MQPAPQVRSQWLAEESEEQPHHDRGTEQCQQHGRRAFPEPQAGRDAQAFVPGIPGQAFRERNDEDIGGGAQMRPVTAHANTYRQCPPQRRHIDALGYQNQRKLITQEASLRACPIVTSQ